MDDIEVENELTIFSDLGSGQCIDKFCTSNSKTLILDHHTPIRKPGNSIDNGFLEINPHFYSIDGSHAPEDLISYEMAYKIALGAGLPEKEIEKALKDNPEAILKSKGIL